MKIGIVTFNRAYNNGALLQCYALCQTLRNLGAECNVVDYYPYYFKNSNTLSKKFKLSHPPVKSWINRIMLRKVLKQRNHNFESFIDKYIPTTRTFYSLEELQNNCPDFDAFITGSDQVWNYGCTYFDPVFFLDFPKAAKSKKYSYAACVGFKEERLPANLVDDYKRRLAGYESYSVREASAVPIIDKLTGQKARIDIDPTLLLTADNWGEIITDSSENEPYILIYYVQKTHKLQEYARRLAAESQKTGRNLKIICVPCNTSPDVLSGKYDSDFSMDLRPQSGPRELLNLIRHADYVVTNSFHGTVFSIIFQKKFVSLLTEYSGKRNVRSSDLLESLGLTDRAMTDNTNDIDNAVDWAKVNDKLEAMRTSSLNYLKQITDQ